VLLRDYRGRTLGRPGNGRPYEVIFIVAGGASIAMMDYKHPSG